MRGIDDAQGTPHFQQPVPVGNRYRGVGEEDHAIYRSSCLSFARPDRVHRAPESRQNSRRTQINRKEGAATKRHQGGPEHFRRRMGLEE